MLSTLVFLMMAVPPADDAVAPPAPAPVPATAPAPAPAPVLRTDELTKLIVQEAIAQHKIEAAAVKPEVAGVFGAAPSHDKYADFAVNFAAARTPNCLGPDGLKFNPPVIANIRGFGPIMVGGIYALPWLVAAKLKGKCN